MSISNARSAFSRLFLLSRRVRARLARIDRVALLAWLTHDPRTQDMGYGEKFIEHERADVELDVDKGYTATRVGTDFVVFMCNLSR